MKKLSAQSIFLIGIALLSLLFESNIEAKDSWQTPTQNKSTEQANKTAQNQQITTDEKYPLIVPCIPTPKSEADTAQEKKDRCQKTTIEIGTIFIAIATAIILFFQLRVFRKQANLMHTTIAEMKIATQANEKAADASKKYADMLPQVERAYVHPGGWFHNNSVEFFSDVGNYGKTPAIVKKICVEVCERSELPEMPNYSRTELVNLPLYPGQSPQSSRITNRTRKGIKDPVVYGRVWYKDIFNNEHSSGFIYDVDKEGGTHAIEAPPSYTEWD